MKNYKSVCGKDIDTLWLLNDLHRTPQWHAFYMPSAFSDSDSSISLGGHKIRQQKRLPDIDRGAESDGYSSLPSLRDASTSEEFDSDTDSHSDGDDDEYDEDYEDELRELRREAMDFAHEIPGFFDNSVPIPEDSFADARRGNPFLKLLGSLRGIESCLRP